MSSKEIEISITVGKEKSKLNTRDFSGNNLTNEPNNMESKFNSRVPSLYGNSNVQLTTSGQRSNPNKSNAKSLENLR